MNSPDNDESEQLLFSSKIRVSVLFDEVSITIGCKSDYAAHVLFEDLVQRLEAGEEISIDPGDNKRIV